MNMTVMGPLARSEGQYFRTQPDCASDAFTSKRGLVWKAGARGAG